MKWWSMDGGTNPADYFKNYPLCSDGITYQLPSSSIPPRPRFWTYQRWMPPMQKNNSICLGIRAASDKPFKSQLSKLFRKTDGSPSVKFAGSGSDHNSPEEFGAGLKQRTVYSILQPGGSRVQAGLAVEQSARGRLSVAWLVPRYLYSQVSGFTTRVPATPASLPVPSALPNLLFMEVWRRRKPAVGSPNLDPSGVMWNFFWRPGLYKRPYGIKLLSSFVASTLWLYT